MIFKVFFLMTILKVFIEFVTILFLFYVLVFLATRRVGILAPPPGIKTAPAALESEVLTPGPTGKSFHKRF